MARGESSSPGEAVSPCKTYYSILDVPFDASPDEIKKAYRRRAIELHPDKNPDDLKATQKFQELQEAYECLSNPQERAWYDAHMTEIVWASSDADGGSCGSSFNVWPYFSGSCFSGFEDDEHGFFSVYRSVFSKVDGEEREERRKTGSPEAAAAPSFGDSQSPWSAVSAFYSFWESFVTCKSFASADKFRRQEMSSCGRAERRWMERANSKSRGEARREFNECIRRLAAFAKRKDPRVFKHRMKIAEQRRQEKEEREARAELAREELRRRRQERQKLEQEYYKALKAERRALRSQGQAFADSSSSSEESCSEESCSEEGHAEEGHAEEGHAEEEPRKDPHRRESSVSPAFFLKRQAAEGLERSPDSDQSDAGELEQWWMKSEVTRFQETTVDGKTVRSSRKTEIRIGSFGSLDASPEALNLKEAVEAQSLTGGGRASKRGKGGGGTRKEVEVKVVYVCEVCDKSFKSPQQFEAHARSAKHKQNLKRLSAQLEEELRNLEATEDFQQHHRNSSEENEERDSCGDGVSAVSVSGEEAQEEVKEDEVKEDEEKEGEPCEERHSASNFPSPSSRASNCSDSQSDTERSSSSSSVSSDSESSSASSGSDMNEEAFLSFARSRRRAPPSSSSSEEEEEEEDDEEEFQEGGSEMHVPEDEEAFSSSASSPTLDADASPTSQQASSASSKANKANKANKTKNTKSVSTHHSATGTSQSPTKKQSRGKGGQTGQGLVDKEWICQVCGEEFASRNALFKHIREKKHAALKTVESVPSKRRSKK